MISKILLPSIFITFQAGLWLTYFFVKWHESGILAYACAKGFGLNLRVLSIILFISNLRALTSTITYYLPKYTEMVKNLHILSGSCLPLHAIGHTVAHFVNGSYTNLTVSVSGGILLLLLAIVVYFSLNRNLNYDQFEYTHLLYVFWLPLLIVHTIFIPKLFWYFVATIVVYLLDKLYIRLFMTLDFNYVNTSICDDRTCTVSVPRIGNVSSGSYFLIYDPTISFFAHPFSLASGTYSKNLSFFIEKKGYWTSKIHDKISKLKEVNERKEESLQLIGPFNSPACKALEVYTDRVVCIATGIGITPFISVLLSRLQEDDSSKYESTLFENIYQQYFQTQMMPGNFFHQSYHFQKKPITLIWSLRYSKSLEIYYKIISEAAKKYNAKGNFNVKIYITKKGETELQEDDDEIINVYYKRLNLEDEFSDLQDEKISIFYCGSPKLADEVERKCNEKGYTFYKEAFDYKLFPKI